MVVHHSQPEPGLAVISIDGEVDYANAGEITDAIATVLREWSPRSVCVDLASVVFMDSMGVTALINGYQATRKAGASFTVVNPSRFTLTLLAVTGLVDVFGLGTGSKHQLSRATGLA
jgi:anti-sigma B factor antagonist